MPRSLLVLGWRMVCSSESRAWDPEKISVRGFALFEMERQSSFFMTGGLIAAHSEDRQRESIWDSFQRREVYGTSGPRILLWFDLLNPPGTRGQSIPMGGEIAMDKNPIFHTEKKVSYLLKTCRPRAFVPTG